MSTGGGVVYINDLFLPQKLLVLCQYLKSIHLKNYLIYFNTCNYSTICRKGYLNI